MLVSRTPVELALASAAGAAAGLLGSYAQQYVVGTERWPAGVVIGVLLTVTVTALVRSALSSRLGSLASALGWFFVVTVASSRRREGDLVITNDARGWAFLLGGAIVLAAGIALPVRVATR